jgi:plasmid maintenance system antidote protein VapI
MHGRWSIVSKALRELQEQHSLTVTKMAAALDLTRPSFSNVINGNTSLSVPLALRIERRFGLNARDLLIAQLDEDIAAEKLNLMTKGQNHAEAI